MLDLTQGAVPTFRYDPTFNQGYALRANPVAGDTCGMCPNPGRWLAYLPDGSYTVWCSACVRAHTVPVPDDGSDLCPLCSKYAGVGPCAWCNPLPVAPKRSCVNCGGTYDFGTGHAVYGGTVCPACWQAGD